MGMWPFSRKSNRRKSASGAINTGTHAHDAPISRDPAADGADIVSAGPERRKSRRDSRRISVGGDAKKLQKDPQRRRTYSFSPGRKDSLRVTRDENRPPVPELPAQWKGKGRSNTQGPDPDPVQQTTRANTQPIDNTREWQRMPTLHKRSAQEMTRRKSSKKRKEDHDREKEIKAMATFLPTHPSQFKPGRKLSKRQSMRNGRSSRSPDHPSSDISLPLADSLKSSRSENSGNETSFKLSALDVLAPRPTIRYSERPKYVPGASGFMSERSEWRMRKIAERVPVPEGAMKASKRIDELADDLSAGELRELMERDAKRKEKKKIAEATKTEQRIARRQERRRVEEATAMRNGTPSPPHLERGVIGREVIGLGIGTSAVVTSAKRKNSIGSDSGRGKRPAEIFRQESSNYSPIEGSNPVNRFQSSASLESDNMTPVSERSIPVLETAQMGKIGKANVSPTLGPRSHMRGASSISQMMDLAKEEHKAPTPAAAQVPTTRESRRRSTDAPAHIPSSWTSFFKLRSRNKKNATSPSSFSNISRDAMVTSAPAPAPPSGFQPMRSASNVPKRTMSKFREDLPELPLSPPQSRVQSPEADILPPIRTGYPEKRSGIEDGRARYDTPTSGYRSSDAVRMRDDTPTSGYRSIIPSPEPVAVLSQSLASIDSEGSWLSGGRTSRRGTNQVSPYQFHDSSSSLSKKYKELSESTEELGIAEDEYFSRLSPGPEEEYKTNRPSGDLPGPSNDEDRTSMTSPHPSEKSTWGAVARQPTVIQHEPRAMSRQGVLNDYDDDTTSESGRQGTGDGESPTSGPLQRATSVNLGKQHVRNISAGSARLLDVKPRMSGDAKRSSMN